MKLKGKPCHVRESVKHLDNNPHNYQWFFYKEGEEVLPRHERIVLEMGGELVSDFAVNLLDKKKETVVVKSEFDKADSDSEKLKGVKEESVKEKSKKRGRKPKE